MYLKKGDILLEFSSDPRNDYEIHEVIGKIVHECSDVYTLLSQDNSFSAIDCYALEDEDPEVFEYPKHARYKLITPTAEYFKISYVPVSYSTGKISFLNNKYELSISLKSSDSVKAELIEILTSLINKRMEKMEIYDFNFTIKWNKNKYEVKEI